MLFLLAGLQSATKAWPTPLTQDEIDSLLGSRTELSRQEVAELMSNILTDAENEIERTAMEVAREVAADDAGEIAAQTSFAESWKKEAARLDGQRRIWRTCAAVEAVAITVAIIFCGLVR